jgi:bifunctional DNA-binding transcriptional regulator/antitoxin component of YhaV-PrlF toxin-antitoxin module
VSKQYTINLQEDPETGDLILPFPEEFLEETGWKEGDVLEWHDNKDGSFSMTKKETQWVLVECVSTFRMRYMVEVPIGTDDYGKDKSEWALDTVTMQEATEFSQEYLGEQIVSHRVVSKEEALSLCDKDNEYGSSWTEEVKMKNFFTSWKEQNGSKV